MREFNVSGIYATRVTLLSTKCSAVPVRDADVAVEHATGATTLKLTYEGVPFQARIRPDGNFTIPTSPFRDAAGVPSTADFQGRFSGSAMTATINVNRVVAKCTYKIRWSGQR